MSQTESSGLLNGLRLIGTAVATFIVVAALISLFVGTPVLAGFFLGLENALFWIALVAGLVWLGYRTDEFSIGFVVLTIGFVIVVSGFLPDVLTRPFAFISEWAFGTQLSALDRVEFFILSVATVVGLWAVDIRVNGRGKTARGVAGQLENRFKTVVTQYRKVLASAATIILLFAAGAAGLFGDIAGEATRFLAQAPVASGFGATLAGYYYNHIAGIPIVGSVGPWVFFGVAAGAFVLAIGAKYR